MSLPSPVFLPVCAILQIPAFCHQSFRVPSTDLKRYNGKLQRKGIHIYLRTLIWLAILGGHEEALNMWEDFI